MHVLDRMDERAITSRQALGTVRRGEIVAGPETDEYGDAKVTLKRRYAGQLVRVVVAISERDELRTLIHIKFPTESEKSPFLWGSELGT